MAKLRAQIWSTLFAEPIQLPDGRRLCTLADAREFIVRLRGYEYNSIEWQIAIDALLAAAGDGSTGHARTAFEGAIARMEFGASV